MITAFDTKIKLTVYGDRLHRVETVDGLHKE